MEEASYGETTTGRIMDQNSLLDGQFLRDAWGTDHEQDINLWGFKSLRFLDWHE